MQYTKTIYKKDSKGKIRYVRIEAQDGFLNQYSGVLGGAEVTNTSTCEPKNVGRANETTATEQAVLEAQAKIELKMRQGYFETPEEAENEVVIMPMLAKDYKKESHKITFPCYVQPKLDGMRCLAIMKGGEVKMMSRSNKEITTLEHIKQDLMGIYSEGMILDGELYAHGLSFQENMKLIKKYRAGETEQVKYHVYDMVANVPFDMRLNRLLQKNLHEVTSLETVRTVKVNDVFAIEDNHSYFISLGYEGTMVRWGNEGYKIKARSSNLLKYKDFIDETYPVIAVVPSEARPEHATLVCVNNKGDEFKTGMKFSHNEREEILQNKDRYIGQTAEVRFFEHTDDGLPRFPVCVGFRNDK
ncbi:hypothetical protein PP178_04065 [Zeaxanthinibacter sp. PT1]|uniref:ATP-dependent DNA ligase n=1 Tax=Zeaxanthinibacter TaxID=561554 RepID=UPI002349AC10|nr:hypothetical protein [Zeaxanthinibacter sp. PT1]MDC6350716.1 hypothetical protein [Zeaxanthinibacter sp. PT1]